MKEDYFNCGLDRTIKIIGNKWSIAILFELMSGTKRFSEIQHSLGVSPRTLSLRLHQLEKDGILHKKVFAQSPPRVDYSLTRRGQSLNQVVQGMREWGCKQPKQR